MPVCQAKMPARLRLAGKSACKRNRFRYRADALFASLANRILGVRLLYYITALLLY